MATDPFSAPAKGGKLDLQGNLGRLLLVTPTAYEEHVNTTFGEKDMVKADVVVLDGDAPGTKIEEAWIFPGALIGQLKSKVGQGMVLGRLEQGTAKPGQNPPWQLADFTEADAQVARDYLAANASDPFAP